MIDSIKWCNNVVATLWKSKGNYFFNILSLFSANYISDKKLCREKWVHVFPIELVKKKRKKKRKNLNSLRRQNSNSVITSNTRNGE